MWKSIAVVSLGASLGALLRWWLGLTLNAHFPSIPPGTLAANLIGGYVVGVAVAFFATYSAVAPEWRLLVITRFCGGAPPFSTLPPPGPRRPAKPTAPVGPGPGAAAPAGALPPRRRGPRRTPRP